MLMTSPDLQFVGVNLGIVVQGKSQPHHLVRRAESSAVTAGPCRERKSLDLGTAALLSIVVINVKRILANAR